MILAGRKNESEQDGYELLTLFIGMDYGDVKAAQVIWFQIHPLTLSNLWLLHSYNSYMCVSRASGWGVELGSNNVNWSPPFVLVTLMFQKGIHIWASSQENLSSGFATE